MSAQHELLRDLLREAYNQGGPSPVSDAFGRWAEIVPWQVRRPIERAWAHQIERALSGELDRALSERNG